MREVDTGASGPYVAVLSAAGNALAKHRMQSTAAASRSTRSVLPSDPRNGFQRSDIGRVRVYPMARVKKGHSRVGRIRQYTEVSLKTKVQEVSVCFPSLLCKSGYGWNKKINRF